MNGPQHYAEAERLLDMAETELEHYAKADYGSHDERVHLQQSQWATARAQVEATLALAAATMTTPAIGPTALPQHNMADGRWCQWSGVNVTSGTSCPAGCPDSESVSS